MKILNPSGRGYETHCKNIAQIILSAKRISDARKRVDLYLETIGHSAGDFRDVTLESKEPMCSHGLKD